SGWRAVGVGAWATVTSSGDNGAARSMVVESIREGAVTQRPVVSLTATVLDAPDPRALAGFYQQLLEWPLGRDEPDWVTLRPPHGGAGLSFQTERAHIRPTWPAGPGDQQMQMHLDIEV